MAKTVAIGIQDFHKIIEEDCFYIDKSYFIKEWWESKDDVTLITRPRRFGKTLTMSMVECFFPYGILIIAESFQSFLFGNMRSIESFRGHIR